MSILILIIEEVDLLKNKTTTVEDKSNETIEKTSSHQKLTDVKCDYESCFLSNKDIGKTPKIRLVINRDYYNIMSRLLGEIGNNRISINNYLNNILESHFKQYSNEISELFKRKQSKDLFKH